ncbi:MAG: caspase family protein [Thermodesulfovibrio sp.]|nr:caspase family protein [Thermodesulfovibrio sp.]
MFKKFKILLLLFYFFLIIPVFAGEPPTEPILKIETGMHLAIIKSISSDEKNQYLLTASYDNTIRLWDVKKGILIKTFRLPLSGSEKLEKAIISPDSRQIAALTSKGVYIFDKDTAKILKILPLTSDFVDIFYSQNGKNFAIYNKYNGSSEIYDTKDYSLRKKFKDRIIFTPSGDILLKENKSITLYDENLKIKKKLNFSLVGDIISFSPTGDKIAVGYSSPILNKDRHIIIDIYSADLKKIHTIKHKTDEITSLYKIFWSSDEKEVYGVTGFESFRNICLLSIINWKLLDKKAEFIDIPSFGEVTDVIHLRDNNFAFASNLPSLGIIDNKGKPKFLIKAQNAIKRQYGLLESISGIQTAPLLSYDGTKIGVEFIVENSGFKIYRAVLDVKNNEFKFVNNFPDDLYPSSLKDFKMPNGRRFELGKGVIELYDKKDKLLWKTIIPTEVAWEINLSKDGKILVAILGDGSIRWYRMQDGKELLAFFLHSDLRRWILWTPKGYYTASVGGEELIGWHINTGKDKEADFFPASRFRDRFYRPDIIAKLFETYDEEKAIALANEESGRKRTEASIKDILPPVITILSPSDGERITKNEITVRYSIRNPSGEPVTAIKVLIDGRPVSKQRGVVIVEKGSNGSRVQEFKLSVPERDFELSLIAENRYTSSVPSTVRLYWAGRKEEYIVKPKLYILAIGISKYKDESLRLRFAHKDAEDFVRIMKTQKGKLYEDVIVKLLTDEKATKDEILDGLEWLQRETTSKDIAMLFIAGHGVNDNAGIYYFLPQNADIDKLKRTGIAFSEIKNTVSSIAGKVVMFIDTCHAGGVMGKRAVTDITGIINELTSAENGVVVFASSTGRQYSLEDPTWENGAFTKALVEGIGGKADLLGKGKITVNMLDAYIAERVKELTKGRQTPVTTKPQTVPDFPVAVR